MNTPSNARAKKPANPADEILLKNPHLQAAKAKVQELMRQTLEDALEGELDNFLGYGKHERTTSTNARNGYGTKTVHAGSGDIELKMPRDRQSDFQPQIVKKRQRVLEDFSHKVIALYSKGMTVRDIQEILEDIYGTRISPSLISSITDRVMPSIEQWQSRPLESVYAVCWLDCLFYRVRHESRVINKAVYVMIGLTCKGHKDILGFWISEKESSGFWLGILNDIKSRGVNDVLIFSTDGITGIEDAIKSVYPKSDYQRCVVHQIRNTLKYVNWRDKKELAKDLKSIYGSATIKQAETAMNDFEIKWQDKYPYAVKSWRTNWNTLTTYFNYPVEIRKIIYTTNIIESVNSKLRKIASTRRVFPTDEALLKVLYMAAQHIERKWTVPMHNWGTIYAQFMLLFEDRVPKL